MRNHTHNLTFPVFSNYPVRVTFTNSIIKQARKICGPDYAAGDGQGDPAALTLSNSDGWAVMLLPHNPAPATVAHEAYHVIAALLKWIGAAQEEEVIAYHLGYLVDRILAWSKTK